MVFAVPGCFSTCVTKSVPKEESKACLVMAFSPSFTSDDYFYVYYTDTAGDTVVARYRVTNNPNIADPASEAIILKVDQPTPDHNGGLLVFGPDGYLYIGLGDGGPVYGDESGNSQNTMSLLGTILRLDVLNDFPYTIPPSNPFAGQAGGREEIWVYGLRNPWRFAFDPLTDDLFIADVGVVQARGRSTFNSHRAVVGRTTAGISTKERTFSPQMKAVSG